MSGAAGPARPTSASPRARLAGGAHAARAGRPGLFDRAGTWAAGRAGKGVRQLRANLRVATGGRLSEPELDELTVRAMRSYARYWQEAFRLPAMDHRRIVADTRSSASSTSSGRATRAGA